MNIGLLLSGLKFRRSPVDPPDNVSNARNVQTLPFTTGSQDYTAFGFMTRMASPTMFIIIQRVGTGHLTGGKVYYRTYNSITGELGSQVLLEEYTGINTPNLEDVAGGYIEETNEIIVFFTDSPNGFNGQTVNTRRAYFIKYNASTMQPTTSRIDYIGASSGVNALNRGWAFGRISKGWSSGEYFISLVQRNVETTPVTFRPGILRTTDNFSTFTQKTIVETTSEFSENITLADPATPGRLINLCRFDNGGDWRLYVSTNSGNTWTYLGRPPLSYYNDSTPIYSFMLEDDGKFSVIFQDRTSSFIGISRHNTFANVINNVMLNPPTGIAYNFDAGSYKGLGYPNTIKIGEGVYYHIWSNETQGDFSAGAAGAAVLRGTRDNFTATMAPAQPPTLTWHSGGTTSGYVNIEGYTDDQLQNVDYFMMELSTESNFSTFAAAQIRAGETAIPVQNIRVLSIIYFLTQLTASATYYFRVKAVNGAGESSFQTVSFTT